LKKLFNLGGKGGDNIAVAYSVGRKKDKKKQKEKNKGGRF